jgi:hypothetical protein
MNSVVFGSIASQGKVIDRHIYGAPGNTPDEIYENSWSVVAVSGFTTQEMFEYFLGGVNVAFIYKPTQYGGYEYGSITMHAKGYSHASVNGMTLEALVYNTGTATIEFSVRLDPANYYSPPHIIEITGYFS